MVMVVGDLQRICGADLRGVGGVRAQRIRIRGRRLDGRTGHRVRRWQAGVLFFKPLLVFTPLLANSRELDHGEQVQNDQKPLVNSVVAQCCLTSGEKKCVWCERPLGLSGHSREDWNRRWRGEGLGGGDRAPGLWG